jgi:hypothetical protein
VGTYKRIRGKAPQIIKINHNIVIGTISGKINLKTNHSIVLEQSLLETNSFIIEQKNLFFIGSFVESNLKASTFFEVSSDYFLKSAFKAKKESLLSIDCISNFKLQSKHNIKPLLLESLLLEPIIPYFEYQEPSGTSFSEGTLKGLVLRDIGLSLGTGPLVNVVDNSNINSDYVFKKSGDWIREFWSNSRGYVYRSNYLDDNEKSSMNFEFFVPSNAINAKITLDYYITSQRKKDYFVFMLDSNPVRVSGDVGWNDDGLETKVNRGYHLLESAYIKDSLDSDYLDRAAIDNIRLTYNPLLTYSANKDVGYRISPPIDLSSINFYTNSKISSPNSTNVIEIKKLKTAKILNKLRSFSFIDLPSTETTAPSNESQVSVYQYLTIQSGLPVTKTRLI